MVRRWLLSVNGGHRSNSAFLSAFRRCFALLRETRRLKTYFPAKAQSEIERRKGKSRSHFGVDGEACAHYNPLTFEVPLLN
ncbi:MAG: hypothetical protein QOF72_2842 [Blastocatellia bacterium]|nr:hypothetical protein [Blastocatellia bacterium]